MDFRRQYRKTTGFQKPVWFPYGFSKSCLISIPVSRKAVWISAGSTEKLPVSKNLPDFHTAFLKAA
jgi:hypothetical protein